MKESRLATASSGYFYQNFDKDFINFYAHLQLLAKVHTS